MRRVGLIHFSCQSLQVSIEGGIREDLITSLRDRGHNITEFDINLGIAEVQAVMKSSDGFFYGERSSFESLSRQRKTRLMLMVLFHLTGASDSRKNGVAKAY